MAKPKLTQCVLSEMSLACYPTDLNSTSQIFRCLCTRGHVEIFVIADSFALQAPLFFTGYYPACNGHCQYTSIVCKTSERQAQRTNYVKPFWYALNADSRGSLTSEDLVPCRLLKYTYLLLHKPNASTSSLDQGREQCTVSVWPTESQLRQIFTVLLHRDVKRINAASPVCP